MQDVFETMAWEMPNCDLGDDIRSALTSFPSGQGYDLRGLEVAALADHIMLSLTTSGWPVHELSHGEAHVFRHCDALDLVEAAIDGIMQAEAWR